MKPDETPLNLNETCVFIGLKKSRIYYLVFKKQVPHYKIGRSLRFYKSELAEWLKSKKQGVLNG